MAKSNKIEKNGRTRCTISGSKMCVVSVVQRQKLTASMALANLSTKLDMSDMSGILKIDTERFCGKRCS